MKKPKPATESECRRAIKRLKEMEAKRTQPKPACAKCRFAYDADPDREIDEAPAIFCFRYPPAVGNPGTSSEDYHFPFMSDLPDSFQWCGEFEAKT